ncbi:glycoside hydrolase family 13 protein [Salipaludibacillus aurantiacus]|uniref:oligo-1,6-glucosidase n=1 Tax=Salipaludibacillus aurantiacus TaxID=1601833 RepID=A0A1H9RQ80_9BACI|nr:alpha-glucosidase [Salipaludibacillus aurantiacus]SER74922.1 oligo-1,6-glucosidase [Salipaludibacillus aurantiacus]
MKRQWWKEAVVYQVYPRSFNDSNGDGIGDLQGIIEKADYLQELGVDVVWLSPVYKSPNDDNGYDISDYQQIMDEFGTMEDWDELLDALHDRGIKLIMDLVVNHTSDEHPWFVESRQSKDNPYRDYYIWRDPKPDGSEPNNWVSFFSGSAWEYDDRTNQYFLHLFTKRQPDLNWENTEVRNDVYKMMTWWLDRGVDGFRMDVINNISKSPGLPDASVKDPDSDYQFAAEHFANGPRLMEFLGEMKERVLKHYDIMTVGETAFLPIDSARKMTDENVGFLNMVFQFEHMAVDAQPGTHAGKWETRQWELPELKHIMTKWDKEMEGGGWNSLYFNNHDQPRQVSRFGDDKHYHKHSAKLLATYLHTMRGTPYIYQGEELGMTNVRFPSIEDYRDVEIHNMYKEYTEERGYSHEEVMNKIWTTGRDNARTPVQWDDSENGGFTTGTPWIKVNPNYREINAKQQMSDPDSIFNYYKQLIELRKQEDVIVYGSYELYMADHEELYVYTRSINGEKLLVILNFFAGEPVFELPEDIAFDHKTLLISNYEVKESESISSFTLRPYEARVYKLN